MRHKRQETSLSASRPTVLLVDDEVETLKIMRTALEGECDVQVALDLAEAMRLLEQEWVQVVFFRHHLERPGIAFCSKVLERWPETIRIVVTNSQDASSIVPALDEAGIHQLLILPLQRDHLLLTVRNAVRIFRLMRENERLTLEMRYLTQSAKLRLERRRKALGEGTGFETITRTPASPINQSIDQARRYASFDIPVLLTGAVGTGKKRFAQAMHLASLRSSKPFYAFDFTGIPPDVAALHLFGARRGILPGGAHRPGLLQKADRGTLYLSGLDGADPEIQLALLRFVRDGVFTPVGGQDLIESDLRILCGASETLALQLAEGRFLPALYHALAIGRIALPPLCQRKVDISLLAQHFASELSHRLGKSVRGFAKAALDILERYPWPGNLYELAGEITRMVIFTQNEALGTEVISSHILHALPDQSPFEGAQGALKSRVEAVEKRFLQETLARHSWNKSRAAAELGLSRVGLRAKLDRYGMSDPSGSIQEET